MCLDRVKVVYEKPPKEVWTGYKVFSGTRTQPNFLYHPRTQPLPLNRWLRSSWHPYWWPWPPKLEDFHGKQYVSGFHVLSDEKDAAHLAAVTRFPSIVVKVLASGIVAKGHEYWGPTFIARKIFIPEEA